MDQEVQGHRRRSWRLNAAALLALLVLAFAASGVIRLFAWDANAPTASAVVTELVPRGGDEVKYYVRFHAQGGQLCEGQFFLAGTGEFVVGDPVEIHYSGPPAQCANVRPTTDSTWWIPYPVFLVAIAAFAIFVFVAWRRPDILGRFAIRRGWAPVSGTNTPHDAGPLLAPPDAEFLTHTGLPNSVLTIFTTEPRPGADAVPAGLLGYTGNGEPVILHPSGTVVVLDEASGDTEVINTSVQQFAACLDAVADEFGTHRVSRPPMELAADLERQLSKIDADALLDPDGYWATFIDDVADGKFSPESSG